MTDPNRVTAHFGEVAVPAHIRALEGGGGYMRVWLDWQESGLSPAPGMEPLLEMHDGGRFTFTIVEALETEAAGQGEFRMKLLRRG